MVLVITGRQANLSALHQLDEWPVRRGKFKASDFFSGDPCHLGMIIQFEISMTPKS